MSATMPNPIAATDPFTCVPIECCDPYTENLIARFDSLEAAGKAGFDPDSIRAVLAGKCQEYSRAIWRIAEPTKSAPPAPQCRRRRKVQSCPNAVAVEAYDLATGETVKAYPSLGAVAEDGFQYQKVQSASLRGTSYGGLGWRRVASTETNKRYASNAPRVIQAIDPSTGRVVKTYPSLSALAGDGFQPACVRRVIDGAYRQYKGCLWREIAAPDDYRTPRQLAYARAVQSFDPETGRTIQEYGSLAEAEAAGFVGVGIRNAIQNGWRHHGVRWRYAQADTVENRGGHKPASVESYEADTLAEVADLYKDFDRQESSRTSGDITRAYAGTEPRLADVPDYIVKRCTTGIAISIWGVHYPTHADAAKRSAEAMRHVDFILFAHRIMGGRSAIFTKASTVAAMFEGFQESPCEAGTFWTAVREGTGIDPKSPDRKLRDYLLTRKIISPNGTGQKKRGPSASQYEVLNRCLKEWHRWQALNARREAA